MGRRCYDLRMPGTAHPLSLITPTHSHVASYVDALQRGWSANNERPQAAAREERESIATDVDAFLALCDNPQGGGPPVNMLDGTQVERLPSMRRWLWDADGFAGTIQLRWQLGPSGPVAELPPYCLGHIGYGVVPWKQRRGYATRALALILPEALALGLPHVEITTDPSNTGSQKVIEANGGVLLEHFTKPAQFGSKPALRYRIALVQK